MSELSLWQFCPDPTDTGEVSGFASPEFDDRRWREVAVPGDFDRCYPGLETYEGVGWFRHRLEVPEPWAGRRVTLRFEGVTTRADVWVNGARVGTCDAPNLPFSFDIDSHLKPGALNLIAARVDNRRRPGEVPGCERGWRNLGGITREVTLDVGDLCVIETVATIATPTRTGGDLHVDLRVANGRRHSASLVVGAMVLDGEGAVLASLPEERLGLAAHRTATVSLRGSVPGVEAWSPSEPRLYDLLVSLHDNEAVVCSKTLRIGFRSVEVSEGRLLLNGEPVTLTGFNRHEDSPTTNACPDVALARRDLMAMREAGANFVRLCHYPHDPRELDLCDELGLLAMDEIPLYWWNGLEEGERASVAKLAAAEGQLRRLVARDRNHPSVIFWSVSNETQETRPEVVEGNRRLIRVAQKLDPSRFAVHVSDHWHDDPHFDQDDVVCVNAYPSFGAIISERRSGYDLAVSTEAWRSDLARLHQRFPEKPILVSEFGYASLHDVHHGGFSGDLHAEVLAAELAGMDAPYVCGAAVWCWADHAWPPAHFDYCGSLAVSPYGVVTRDRRRKPAYWRVRELFRRRRSVTEAPAEPEPHRWPSGLAVHMVRTRLDDVPALPFPAGFSVRTYRPGDAGLWTDIWSEADPFGPMDPETFFQAFGDDLPAMSRRCYFVENEAGAAVATITSWYNRSYQGRDHGQIHWVATRQPYWGKGIGKAMLSYALRQMAAWHDRAFLGTQTERLPAIKIYLDLGFVPDLDHPGARAAWREVRAALAHPVLEAMEL